MALSQVARLTQQRAALDRQAPSRPRFVGDVAGAADAAMTAHLAASDPHPQYAKKAAVSALTSTAGVCAINCALGDYFTFTLTEDVSSITFSNLPAAGKAQTLRIRLKQHASAAKTVAWPASFKWPGGVAGVMSATLSAYDVLTLQTFDQGTRWEASLVNGSA